MRGNNLLVSILSLIANARPNAGYPLECNAARQSSIEPAQASSVHYRSVFPIHAFLRPASLYEFISGLQFNLSWREHI